MVKTRSKGDLAEGEEEICVDPEIQTIKGELADLRGDITEIKNFLKKICPTEPLCPATKVTDPTLHTSIHQVGSVDENEELRGTGGVLASQNPRSNANMKGLGEIRTEPPPVQFTIEHNTINPYRAPGNSNERRAVATLGQQGMGQGLNSGISNHSQSGNPYGIEWNHTFFHQNQYNPVTGQFISGRTSGQNLGVQLMDAQGYHLNRDPGVNPSYVEAIIKGPRLEIPLFSGDDPISWLKQCEKFYEISGTPMEQWVNIALGHLQGRAANWFKGIGVPWKILNWNQFFAMLRDRFSEINAHEAVEQLQNMKQGAANVANYIDRFEECMSLVKRDHPYLQEAFLMSCFIGGLKRGNQA